MNHRSERDRLRLPARPRGARALIVVLLVVAGGPLAACASRDTPRMSGFAVGDTRVVSVGDVVELRVPLRADGSRQWRVTSYDSLYLQLINNPQAAQRSDGSWEMVSRARARTAGETEVVMTELPRAGQERRVVRFKVRVRD